MELSLSGWVTLACAVLIVAVGGHAFWLRWRTQRNRLRIEIDPAAVPTSGADDLELLRGELPNGGARVIRPGEVDPAARRTDSPLPLLLDTVAGARGKPSSTEPLTAGPRAGHGDTSGAARAAVPSGTARRADIRRESELDLEFEPAPEAEPEPEPLRARPTIERQVRTSAQKNNADSTGLDKSSSNKVSSNKVSSNKISSDKQTAESQLHDHEELFVMRVLCRQDEGFDLAALMQSVTEAGMRFGDQNIFHRYKDGRAGRNRIEYSMANAVEPGAFDLSDSEARTRAVAFFMRLPLTTGSEPMQVFEDMLTVVQTIAHRFDGEILDEQQGVVSAQTIEHCRERIHEFMRKQQIRGFVSGSD